MGPSKILKANQPQGVNRAGKFVFGGRESSRSAGRNIRSVRLPA